MSRNLKIGLWILLADIVVTFGAIFFVYKFVHDERIAKMAYQAITWITQTVSLTITMFVMFWRGGAKNR